MERGRTKTLKADGSICVLIVQASPLFHTLLSGASTGGTEAVRELLMHLPADSPGVAIVQHMPAMFTPSFAERLNLSSSLEVSEAAEGDLLPPGRAVVARGDAHLAVRLGGRGWYVRYTHQEPVNRHCPSVDELFDSAVRAAAQNAVGILLTGMGDDGARGLLRLRQCGALTVAQDTRSCVVYGLPKAAEQLDAVELHTLGHAAASGPGVGQATAAVRGDAGVGELTPPRRGLPRTARRDIEHFPAGAYDSVMANEVITEVRDHIGIVRLNRPDKLNALNSATMTQVIEALEGFDTNPDVRCMLLTGDQRAFAAGADINEMADASMTEMHYRNMFGRWERIRRLHKPIVAAVSGYALGGGCELMMYCDIIIASETARFGQPEINIGVIPGAGGTHRLTRAVGKAHAMDLILTGRMITAQEAHAMGLISRVVPAEQYFDEALKVCHELCDRPPIALQLAKEAVGKAFDTTLTEGLEFEKKLFCMLFATDDQKEGMRAFVEKRQPVFVGR